MKRIYRHCKTTALVLGTLALMACFSVNQERDTSNDAWDKPMGAYPTQIQGLAVDPNGDLHIAVSYLHLFTPSQPDQEHFGVRSRNNELRIFTLSRGKWDSLALQNWDPYGYASYNSAYGNQNAFSQDQDGFPWIVFSDRPTQLARLQNRHWIKSRLLDSYSSEAYLPQEIDGQNLQCGNYTQLGVESESFRVCLTTRDTTYANLNQNGPTESYSMPGPWSSLYIQGSKTPPVLAKSDFGAYLFYSPILHGDTLNAYAMKLLKSPANLRSYDTNEVLPKDSLFWVRSIKSKSLTDSLPKWTTEMQALNPDYTPLRFTQVRNKIYLLVQKIGSFNDSMATFTWQMDKMSPHFFFSNTSDNRNQQYQENFTLDPNGCGHFIGRFASNPKNGPPNYPIDTSLIDTGITPTKKISVSQSIFFPDTLAYRNLCQSGEDTLASTSPDTSENGYARQDKNYGNLNSFKYLLAADSLGQPWLVRNYSAPELPPSYPVYYSSAYNADFTQDPDVLVKEWRAKFRFDLQVREGTKWKTIALPFQ